MKKVIVILALSTAMLSACESDPGNLPKTPAEGKIHEIMAGFDGKVDMTAFVSDAQRGVWLFDEFDIVYTNGEVCDGKAYLGAWFIRSMMLLPDGVCRTFGVADYLPDSPIVYSELQWSVDDQAKNVLVLYSKSVDEMAKTNNFDQYDAETELVLLCYKDGVFVMKGMQPFAYWGGETSKGVYKDYCKIVGHIATDKETVDKYLSYISGEEYKENNPH